jgi:hypothetical protein
MVYLYRPVFVDSQHFKEEQLSRIRNRNKVKSWIRIRKRIKAMRTPQPWVLQSHTTGQCCGSGMFIPHPKNFPIPDPGTEFFPSRIRIKKCKFLTQKRHRIPDPDPDFLPIPDPGSKGSKGTGSRIRGSKSHRIPDPGVKKAPDPGSGPL